MILLYVNTSARLKSLRERDRPSPSPDVPPPRWALGPLSTALGREPEAIIAAARSARVKLVATYDRNDLLSKRQEILDAFRITVAPPDEILVMLRLR